MLSLSLDVAQHRLRRAGDAPGWRSCLRAQGCAKADRVRTRAKIERQEPVGVWRYFLLSEDLADFYINWRARSRSFVTVQLMTNSAKCFTAQWAGRLAPGKQQRYTPTGS